MNPVTARRGSARLLVAAMIASAVTAFVPAQAAGKPAPIMLGNSVAMGWSNNARLVAASFDRVLDATGSSATVVDRDGAPVGGFHTFSADTKTLSFVPQLSFNEEGAPYTVTFTAKTLGQDVTIAPTVETLDFSIDVVTPFPPDVQLNDGTQAVTVSLLDDELSLNGTAADDLLGSGIAKIQVHYYNPAANPQQATLGGIPQAFSKSFDVDCTGACPTSTPVEIDLSDLGTGLWTLKVSVTDAAGNRSAESGPLRVLRVAS
ncbi:MAG: hypothetical protein ACLGH3_01150 [Actinomycetota bacterium]